MDEHGFLASWSELGCESQAWGLSSRMSWITESRNESSEGKCEKVDFFLFSFVSSFLLRVFSPPYPLTLPPACAVFSIVDKDCFIGVQLFRLKMLEGLYLYMGNNSETVSLAHYTSSWGIVQCCVCSRLCHCVAWPVNHSGVSGRYQSVIRC